MDKRIQYYLAFDGDDTLWKNEITYQNLDDKIFNSILPNIGDIQTLKKAQNKILKKNINSIGFGMKIYALSYIEAMCQLYPELPAHIISQLIDICRPYITQPVQLIANAHNVLKTLKKRYKLLLITKGDLIEQEYKIKSSGLKFYFSAIHIVSQKNIRTYKQILKLHNIPISKFIMIGNSLQSDIIPVIELGAKAIYIPGAINSTIESTPNAPWPTGILQIKELSDLLNYNLNLFHTV